MKKCFIILAILLFPLVSYAIPVFPMAFWGNVTINGIDAPVDTIIRAYYGDILTGQAIVQESGVYGYNETIKQKLLVGEGDGLITFKFQSQSFNDNSETGGISIQDHPIFESGTTVNINLDFTVAIPTSNNGGSSGSSNSGGSSGGSGGGSSGGGGGFIPSTQPSISDGDTNNDSKVDIFDFNTLMIQWGNTGASNTADFNNDGVVDIFDFNSLMIHWTT